MARGHQRLENLLIAQAVQEGKLAAEDVVGFYVGKKKESKYAKQAVTDVLKPGGVFRAAATKQRSLMYKAQAGESAISAQLAGLQLQGEQEAQTALEAEQKRLANMYGYSSTIKTSGRGVLGQAPVKRARLLGA